MIKSGSQLPKIIKNWIETLPFVEESILARHMQAPLGMLALLSREPQERKARINASGFP